MTSIAEVATGLIGTVPGLDPSTAALFLMAAVTILGIEFFDTFVDFIFFMLGYGKP